MNYKKTYTPNIGYTKLCEMDKCSCKRLEFGIIELNAGDSVTIAYVPEIGKGELRKLSPQALQDMMKGAFPQ